MVSEHPGDHVEDGHQGESKHAGQQGVCPSQPMLLYRGQAQVQRPLGPWILNSGVGYRRHLVAPSLIEGPMMTEF